MRDDPVGAFSHRRLSMTGRIVGAAWVVVAVVCGGCAHSGGGRVYTNEQWRDRGGELGRVALIVSGPARRDADPSASPARARAAVTEALNRLPGTSVVESELAGGWSEAV